MGVRGIKDKGIVVVEIYWVFVMCSVWFCYFILFFDVIYIIILGGKYDYYFYFKE